MLNTEEVSSGPSSTLAYKTWLLSLGVVDTSGSRIVVVTDVAKPVTL